jgi:hypothetical protein
VTAAIQLLLWRDKKRAETEINHDAHDAVVVDGPELQGVVLVKS